MRFQRLATWLMRWRANDRGRMHTVPAAGAMPMLDCESVMRELWDYLDGELTTQRMEAVRGHLEMCKRCFPQFQFEQSFLAALAASTPAHSNLTRLQSDLLTSLERSGLGRR